jgi:hypothetical protein
MLVGAGSGAGKGLAVFLPASLFSWRARVGEKSTTDSLCLWFMAHPPDGNAV